MNPIQVNSTQSPEEENLIDFRKIYSLIKRYWYLFAITFTIAFASSYLYLTYTNPVYSISAKVFIKDRSNYTSASQGFLEGTQLFQPFSNVDNEMVILKSRTMVSKAIEELEFDYSLYVKGNVRDIEIYPMKSIGIVPDSLSPLVIGSKIEFIIKDNSNFYLKMDKGPCTYYNPIEDTYNTEVLEKPISVEGKFGMPVLLGKSLFTINRDTIFKMDHSQKYYFIGYDKMSLVKKWQSALSIGLVNKDASIIALTASSTSINKARDFVNMLSDVYIKDGLDKKNSIATSTIRFIDIQLQLLKDTLNVIENKLVDFRSRNQVMNLTVEAQINYSKLKELESEQARLNIRHKYFKYIREYVMQSKDISSMVVPSILDINDPNLNNLIKNLVDLENEKTTLLLNSQNPNNPFVKAVDSKIEYTKEAISENLNNLDKSTTLAMQELNDNIQELQTLFAAMPQRERDFMSIDRKFKVNDEIYNYLLEKRAEASIAKASTSSDNIIIDYAVRHEASKIAPNSKSIQVFSFIVALLLPMIWVFYLYFIDRKIYSVEDIQRITQIPFLGNIIHAKQYSNTYILENPKSSLAESFRSIKVNIDFLRTENQSQVVGLTSFVSGEGKTFVSLNLATIYAYSGKKVVLVGLDLRKPRIDKELFETKDFGLSNYLAGMCVEADIIHKSGKHENFDFIPTGVIPPNPAELIQSPRMVALIATLRKSYDIIILDSPPIGLVVDYLQLIKVVDVTLYVVRQAVSEKQSIHFVQDLMQQHTISNIGIIMNDIKEEYSNYAYNGRGYNYYGTYTDYYVNAVPHKRKFFDFIKK